MGVNDNAIFLQYLGSQVLTLKKQLQIVGRISWLRELSFTGSQADHTPIKPGWLSAIPLSTTTLNKIKKDSQRC